MFSKARGPNKAEKARMAAIKEGVCLACDQWRIHSHCPDAHHLLSGNKRRGHRYTVGLCQWHHRGQSDGGCSRATMESRYGPSLAHGSKPFHEAFGSDDELLARQDELIGWQDANESDF